MPTVVKMPQLGESIVEGTVLRWLKSPGETVSKFEPLLEINTDKIDTEVPSPAAGTLLAIVAQEGETVAVGAIMAYIGEPEEQIPEIDPEIAPERALESVPEVISANETPLHDGRIDGTDVTETKQPFPVQDASSQTREPDDSKPAGRAFISPVVARIAGEHNINLDLVPGTGMGGRITKKDILAFIEAEPAESIPLPQPDVVEPISSDSKWQTETFHPLTAIRRAIAHHMVDSKHTSPHVTTVFEADMTAVVQHREQHKQKFAEKGVNLTYTPYFVTAAADALREVPQVNARFHQDGEKSGIISLGRIHIGVAVALAEGLIVPVIRDADERNLQGIVRAVNDVANRARRGQLTPDSTRGGTFTITNHGVSGSLIGTPIINQPQSGILGIGAIVKRPVVRSSSRSLLPSAEDAIIIRPMCYLSLTFDHRVLDGATADAFMQVIKNRLEAWPASDA